MVNSDALFDFKLGQRTGGYQKLVEGILSLDSEIRNCMIVTDPEGSILAANAITNEKQTFSQIVNSSSGMIAHWMVSSLNSFGRADALTSELEYMALERKNHRALIFRHSSKSSKLVVGIGITKQGKVPDIYEKATSFLKLA
jgi:hypothetical protein